MYQKKLFINAKKIDLFLKKKLDNEKKKKSLFINYVWISFWGKKN